MNHTIRGSDVFVKEDLRAQLDALSLAAGGYPVGDFRSGFLAALSAVRASIGLPATGNDGMSERWHEVIEYRAERTFERRPEPPAERRFAIRGEREEWPGFEQEAALTRSAPAEVATQRRQPADMTGDDVSLTLFSPQHGRLVTREIGHAWLGNDGYTAFWSAGDWQRVSVEEARSWGALIPDDYGVLVRHAYAQRKREEVQRKVSVLPRERGLLR